MHDRYLYVAEVLALLYAIIYPRKFYVPMFLQLGSIPSYVGYLAKGGNPFGAWTVLMLGIPVISVFFELRRGLNANGALKVKTIDIAEAPADRAGG